MVGSRGEHIMKVPFHIWAALVSLLFFLLGTRSSSGAVQLQCYKFLTRYRLRGTYFRHPSPGSGASIWAAKGLRCTRWPFKTCNVWKLCMGEI